jgi:hypothetical protein
MIIKMYFPNKMKMDHWLMFHAPRISDKPMRTAALDSEFVLKYRRERWKVIAHLKRIPQICKQNVRLVAQLSS